MTVEATFYFVLGADGHVPGVGEARYAVVLTPDNWLPIMVDNALFRKLSTTPFPDIFRMPDYTSRRSVVSRVPLQRRLIEENES